MLIGSEDLDFLFDTVTNVNVTFRTNSYCICVLGVVGRLLMSEKPKCNVAIRQKIKVQSSYMYLFTIEQ